MGIGQIAPKTQDAKARNHRHARERPFTLGIHIAQCNEDVFDVCTGFTKLMKAMREDIQAAAKKVSMELCQQNRRQERH